MASFLKEIWAFLRVRKKLWLAPIIIVMVLLGGVQTLSGPLVGAAVFTGLQDSIARSTEYWRALLGGVMLLLVLLFPQGLVGSLSALRQTFTLILARRLRKSTA